MELTVADMIANGEQTIVSGGWSLLWLKPLAPGPWYRENSEKRAASVGRKKPNPWELYDMHGNVWEWTWDEFPRLDQVVSSGVSQETVAQRTDDVRVAPGGSFIDSSKWLRSASRIGYKPNHQNEHLGFRCAGPARRKG
ncbi:hypothetical protein BE17_11825 [Sorangium cellulosum]|uniref:Sulfatase-modifying factor enzyme-like domain-containing protein n=1 Tax=Sorangium cellulosum TaxID=56 RepID=A0A150RMT8_SORCE|nr:hypothetical protein BE17_11825 [Sorangium cellulosum]